MSDNLYITATEARSGKSLVSLGVMEMLLRKIEKVGFFRPIAKGRPGVGELDNDVRLISQHFKLPIPYEMMFGVTTWESGKGEDVEKVRLATRMARERAGMVFPGLEIDGPMQYDAAVDEAVAGAKMPGSVVAAGNNTYKAVQRSAGAVAIGPILQGLKHPVKDLSRGCTVTDIVNTVAITAIQAQSQKGFL